jgi:hypothetical protein
MSRLALDEGFNRPVKTLPDCTPEIGIHSQEHLTIRYLLTLFSVTNRKLEILIRVPSGKLSVNLPALLLRQSLQSSCNSLIILLPTTHNQFPNKW